jgi:predicted amidohydrolase YtcJ
MVVLGEDILTVPVEAIIDIPIDMTIIEGKTVFARET